MKSITKKSAGGRLQGKKASLCSGSRGAQAQQFSGFYSNMMYKCSGRVCACGAKFNSERSMRYHARKCPKMSCCGRYYPNISDLRKHIDTAHNNPIPVDEKVVNPRCQFCGKNDFITPSGRDRHSNYYCTKNPHLFLSPQAQSKGTAARPLFLKRACEKHTRLLQVILWTVIIPLLPPPRSVKKNP